MTESVEDIMSRLRIAIKTGKCPICGTALVVDRDDEWLHCPVCGFACGV
jgi:uncharacterized Zn finger protein (UPF0148 family)